MTLALPTPAAPLRIGTRGSPLALAQARETRARLMAAFALPEAAFEIVAIRTTGDRVQDRPLKEIGGKGLFTREIEEALAAGAIDIAVHSMKDMPTRQPTGLLIDCLLPREDVRDGFVAPRARSLGELEPGSIVGTSSLRRRAQLLNRHPLLRVVEFRGNVQTRLRKLGEGVAHCTFLAMAGLNRLGMAELARSALDPGEMLPAVAQGAIGVERRAADRRAARCCGPTGRRRWPTRAAPPWPTRPRWAPRWRGGCWCGCPTGSSRFRPERGPEPGPEQGPEQGPEPLAGPPGRPCPTRGTICKPLTMLGLTGGIQAF